MSSFSVADCRQFKSCGMSSLCISLVRVVGKTQNFQHLCEFFIENAMVMQ
jgi:hypothetical protein